mmetsp:Transcript_13882/g.41363  ORF Transcript_13882/g.41363 Transcript_13882/m.41363 type:complete len:342 (+) Transcript_13882:748-1773(+)
MSSILSSETCRRPAGTGYSAGGSTPMGSCRRSRRRRPPQWRRSRISGSHAVCCSSTGAAPRQATASCSLSGTGRRPATTAAMKGGREGSSSPQSASASASRSWDSEPSRVSSTGMGGTSGKNTAAPGVRPFLRLLPASLLGHFAGVAAASPSSPSSNSKSQKRFLLDAAAAAANLSAPPPASSAVARGGALAGARLFRQSAMLAGRHAAAAVAPGCGCPAGATVMAMAAPRFRALRSQRDGVAASSAMRPSLCAGVARSPKGQGEGVRPPGLHARTRRAKLASRCAFALSVLARKASASSCCSRAFQKARSPTQTSIARRAARLPAEDDAEVEAKDTQPPS